MSDLSLLLRLKDELTKLDNLEEDSSGTLRLSKFNGRAVTQLSNSRLCVAPKLPPTGAGIHQVQV